jgi:hypothetical protein
LAQYGQSFVRVLDFPIMTFPSFAQKFKGSRGDSVPNTSCGVSATSLDVSKGLL